MPLASGTRLGPYEIVAALGAGGMGEVYKARDTRLDRIVAIKVLPELLAADPQFRERFDREARTISALDHPHICALYDVGEAVPAAPESLGIGPLSASSSPPSPPPSAPGFGVASQSPAPSHDTVRFLVMQFLEGETLADRVAKGPLPLNEALRLAAEIADALDKAHRAGIVHRDLKPANIFLVARGASARSPTDAPGESRGRSADDKVYAKLLDFGLAKSAAPVVSGGGATILPTTPINLTAQGTILGTFQYMAPEQIEGKEADPRTDIFAFGVVLYEMTTARKAFEGKTHAGLIGAILEREPPAVSSVRPGMPSSLDRVIATCVAKDPDDRWQTARDLLRELKWIADSSSQVASATATGAPASARRKRVTLPWMLSAVLTTVATLTSAAAIYFWRAPGDTRSLRFFVTPPDGWSVGLSVGYVGGANVGLTVSPDGRRLAFVGYADGRTQLWLRNFDTLVAQALAGTDGAASPFWSPDSRSLGFFAGGKLKKIDVAGGPPVTLCDTPENRGGTWSRDGVIVFAPYSGGIGGAPESVGLRRRAHAGHRATGRRWRARAAGVPPRRPSFFLPHVQRWDLHRIAGFHRSETALQEWMPRTSW